MTYDTSLTRIKGTGCITNDTSLIIQESKNHCAHLKYNIQYISLNYKSIIALTGILANDEKLYYSVANKKGGKIKVCQALQERDEKIKSEYEIRIAAKDAEIEEINAMHASILAEKEAEIAELKRLLASKQ